VVDQFERDAPLAGRGAAEHRLPREAGRLAYHEADPEVLIEAYPDGLPRAAGPRHRSRKIGLQILRTSCGSFPEPPSRTGQSLNPGTDDCSRSQQCFPMLSVRTHTFAEAAVQVRGAFAQAVVGSLDVDARRSRGHDPPNPAGLRAVPAGRTSTPGRARRAAVAASGSIAVQSKATVQEAPVVPAAPR